MEPLPPVTAVSEYHHGPTKTTPFFTQSQLALALTIQRSKPEGVSTKGAYAYPIHTYQTMTEVSRLLSAAPKTHSGRPEAQEP